MKIALTLPFLLTACALPAPVPPATKPQSAPSEIAALEACQEHMLAKQSITMQEWPQNARGREINAYVVISYELDGSGKAKNQKIIHSSPAGLFDKVTASLLERTDFKIGVKAQSCNYLQTFNVARRR
jgi:TonB family protein